jgi:hypothetical protein
LKVEGSGNVEAALSDFQPSAIESCLNDQAANLSTFNFQLSTFNLQPSTYFVPVKAALLQRPH